MSARDHIDLYGVKESEYRMYEESRENRRKGIRKSAYYHRYFEGYVEFYTELPDGARKIRRMYAAPWKVLSGTKKEWIARKILYAILLVLAGVFFTAAGTRNAMCNIVWYGGIAGGVETVFFLLSLIACIRYLRCRRRMTLYEMKSSCRFFRMICAAAAAGSFILMLFAFRFGEYMVGSGYLLCTGFLLALTLLEYTATYDDVENTSLIPAEATYIQ